MPNYFEIFASKLDELGVFTYLLPFILISAMTYALKSKILSDSPFINGVVSLSMTFMVVFGFPIATGFSIAPPLSTFFMQVSVFMLVFIIGTMIASIFYPNMSEWLPTVFKSRGMLMNLLGVSIALFVTSGLVGVFTTGLGAGGGETPSAPRDVILIASGLVIFIVVILIATQVASGRARGHE